MTTTTVSSHWIHHRFVQNLINASHERDLHRAAKEWRFSSLHASDVSLQCQLCNTHIIQCVTLHNAKNGNYIVLGENCYDKLLGFLKSGHVQSALPSRDAQTRTLRQHWKRLLHQLKDRTVVGWLRDELQGGRLPDDIAAIVYTISRIGLAPTTGDADRVIAYYKATRRFTIEALLEGYSLQQFKHRRLMPTGITINQIERVRTILDRDRERRATRYEREQISRERVWFAQTLASSIKQLNNLRDRLRAATETGVAQAAEALVTVERLIGELTSLDYSNHTRMELQNARWDMETLVRQTIKEQQWHVKDPETVLYVTYYSYRHRITRSYILVKRDDRWRQITNIVFNEPRYESNVAYVCTAIVLEEETCTRVMPITMVDNALVQLSFTVPSQKVPGTYVAMYNGKVVLPSRPIRTPGSHHAFMMNDAGKYYRAWVL